MPIESSGEVRLRGAAGDGRTDINEEINSNATDTDVSLGTLNTTAFTAVSDGSVVTGRAMSEMRGYSAFDSALPSTEADGALGESLYFNATDEIVYLDRNTDFTNTRTTGTFSFWIKKNTANNANNTIYASGDDQFNRFWVNLGTSGSVIDSKLRIIATTNSNTKIQLVYDYPFIDTSSWYHIVVAIDTTKSYQYDRVKVYANGIELKDIDSSVKTAIWPSQNASIKFNNNQRICDTTWATGYSSNMVIADFKFIDGKQLRPDSFGELVQGIWIPKAFNTPSTDTLVTSGLIAKYEFIDNIKDTSGSATTYDGINNSNVTFSNTNYNIANFNGSSSYLDTPLTVISGSTDNADFSISAWVYIETLPGTGDFITLTGNRATSVIAEFRWLIRETSGQYQFEYLRNYGNSFYNLSSGSYPNSVLKEKTWYNITFTYNASNKNIITYLNAANIGSDLILNNNIGSGYSGNGYLHWGQYNPSVTKALNGHIGEILIYDDILSTAEVLQNYNATKHKYTYGLNGFWLPLNNTSIGSIDSSSNLKLHLDASDSSSYGGSGTTWSDLTSNSNNGTISGANFLSSTNGGVFDFDGSNDRISISSSGLLTGDFTIEMWWKFDSLNNYRMLWGGSDYAGSNTTGGLGHYIQNQTIKTWVTNSSGGAVNVATSGNVLSTNKWHHIVLTRLGSTVKSYVDGKEASSGTYSGDLSSANTYIGAHYNDLSNYFVDGKHAQTRVYDKALTAQEVITNYRATQGNYEQVSTIDISGNANNFTATNIDATDHIKDEPLDNYATLNPNEPFADNFAFSEGNTKFTSAVTGYHTSSATMALNSGKWYVEFKFLGSSAYGSARIGPAILGDRTGINSYGGTTNDSWMWGSNGAIYHNNSNIATSSVTATTNDIIGFAIDLDNHRWFISKNGSWQYLHDPATPSTGIDISGFTDYFIGFHAYTSSDIGQFDFGQNGFIYTPPTGFKAMSFKNLPAPAFDPDGATPDKPSNYFKAVTYQGTGGTQGEAYGYKEGSRAAVFNGSSSYISTGINFSTLPNTKSISMWIKSTGSSTVGFGGMDGSYGNMGLFAFDEPAGDISYIPKFGGYHTGDASSVITNAWNHFVVTDTNVNGNVKMYINGSEVTVTKLNSTVYTNNTDMQIGRQMRNNGTAFWHTGTIDEARIFDKVLSLTEVGYLADDDTANIDAISNLVAYYDMEGNSNNVNNNPIDSGQSAVFNGSNSSVEILNSNYDVRGNFSLSLWFNLNDLSANQTLFAKILNTSEKPLTIRVLTDGRLLVEQEGNNSNYNSFSSKTVSANNWYHLVWRADANFNGILYINTVPFLYTNPGTVNINNGVPSLIGIMGAPGSAYNGSSPFNGKIDQIRIYSSALSVSDVEALASETNVPTANLVAHYKLDGNGNDETTNYNAISVNNVTYSSPALPSTYNGTDTNVTYTQDKPYGNINVGFAPDLVWTKSRSHATSHELNDSVRGQVSRLFTDSNSGAATITNGFVSLDSNGFSLDGAGDGGEVNYSGRTYVAWAWKAGGDDVLNEEGSIDSQVSANPDAGFSIVKYAGNGGSATVGTGLNQQVEMVIVKQIDGESQWMIYHKGLTGNTSGDNPYNLYFRGDSELDLNAFGSYDSFTSSVFPVTRQSVSTAHTNNNNENYIAYCFHSVDGFSKIGSYTGNGSDDGPFVYTGFKPAWVMIKWTNDPNSNSSWVIYDNVRNTANEVDTSLRANNNSVDSTVSTRDLLFLSNGFKIDGNSGTINDSSGGYIYMAFAEDPVKYSNSVATLGDGNEFIQGGNYPEDNFKTVLWTGTGNENYIPVGYNPDLVWIKSRNVQDSHQIYDTIRGNQSGIFSNLDNDESIYTDGRFAFSNNGFTVNTTNSGYNQNNATYVGWTWKAAGNEYKSASFNGSSSKIDLPNLGLGGSSERSVSFWVNPSVTARGLVFCSGTGSNGQGFTIDVSSVNKIRVSYYNRDFETVGTAPNNTWSNIVVTYNGGVVQTASNTKVYINGTLQTLTSTGGTYTGVANTSDSNYSLGYRRYTNSLYLNGKIDQVRIFNKALSTNNGGINEIEKLYNETKSTVNTLQVLGDSSCIATYRLNGDALDLSGNYNGNESNIDYVTGSHFAYNILENGTVTSSASASTLSLNTGTVTPIKVSANRDNGFSMMNFIGTSTAGDTVPHGLSKPPEFVIAKQYGGADEDWFTWHKDYGISGGEYQWLRLNSGSTTPTTFSSQAVWNNAAPSSTLFTLNGGGSPNRSGDEHIYYSWHSVPGYSKIGKYTGKGTTAAFNVYLGFEPAWVIIRRIDSANSWVILDSKRENGLSTVSKVLWADSNSDENDGGTTTSINIDSDGFSFTTSQYGGSINTNNGQYIYMAFAHR